MKTVKKTVVDIQKLTDEQIGKIYRKSGEIIRRINEGTILFEDSMESMQKIIIEGKASLFLDVIKGLAEIKYLEYLIDCDALPFIPDGWSVEEHQKGGLFKFDAKKVSLYRPEEQLKGNMGGNDLRKDLSDKRVMNANVLDRLLAYTDLIPREWKRGAYIFFWGTIYRHSDGGLCVRCLFFRDYWRWEYVFLDDCFNSCNPAAIAI